jgi:hypothetical protein
MQEDLHLPVGKGDQDQKHLQRDIAVALFFDRYPTSCEAAFQPLSFARIQFQVSD